MSIMSNRHITNDYVIRRMGGVGDGLDLIMMGTLV